MPLKPGKQNIGHNIEEMESSGHPRDQAIAAALREARKVKAAGGGLYANIHAKQERIAHGSKERMRKPGAKGAPTAAAFKQSARTAKAGGGEAYQPSLTAAIRVGKDVHTGRHHRDIYAALTPAQRAEAGTDGRQFGFVDEGGKYLHRATAMQYARDMGLLSPKHANTTSPHLISEMLADRPAKADGGEIADEPPSPALPLDPTAREKRATQLGYTHHAFHGTRADIPAFDPNRVDVGTHIGTDEQANQRLHNTRKWGDDHTGENVIPVRAKLGKSFLMPDVGSWNDSAEVMQHLVSQGKRLNPDWQPHTHEVRALHEAAINGRLDHQNTQESGALDWHETPHNRFLLTNISKMLRDDGYGSIKYHNIAENAHGSHPGMRHEIQKQYEALDREIAQAYAQENPDVSKIREMETRLRDLRMDPKNHNDKHSYIVLDPAHLRSRFAKFDPAKADEPDLLAAKGGFMRKPRADGGSVNEEAKLHTGPIHSPVAGRTDHLPMHVPSGSYVIPADIIGAMGEGNTMAGFKHMRRMFAGNPYGNQPAPYGQGAKTPYGTDPDQQPYDPSEGPYQSELPGKASGGPANHVAIVAAGGEYVLTPDEVRMAGDGDLERGHRVLDEFVKRYRQKTIKTLQKLPGPAKD